MSQSFFLCYSINTEDTQQKRHWGLSHTHLLGRTFVNAVLTNHCIADSIGVPNYEEINCRHRAN